MSHFLVRTLPDGLLVSQLLMATYPNRIAAMRIALLPRR